MTLVLFLASLACFVVAFFRIVTWTFNSNADPYDNTFKYLRWGMFILAMLGIISAIWQ